MWMSSLTTVSDAFISTQAHVLTEDDLSLLYLLNTSVQWAATGPSVLVLLLLLWIEHPEESNLRKDCAFSPQMQMRSIRARRSRRQEPGKALVTMHSKSGSRKWWKLFFSLLPPLDALQTEDLGPPLIYDGIWGKESINCLHYVYTRYRQERPHNTS